MDGRPLPPLGAGRRRAGLALLRWLEDPYAPQLCRIAGSSGSGRTHLLAWLAAAGLDEHAPTAQQPHAILPGAGMTPRSAAWMLAEQLHLTAAGPEELVTELAEDERRTVLLVGELDRAADGSGRRLVTELLEPLLTATRVRMVLDGGPQPTVPEGQSTAVLDLDEERWTDPEAFADWYERLESANGGGCFRAEDVYPHPGLARLARRIPADAQGASVAEAWWAAVPEAVRGATRALGGAVGSLGREEWALLPGSGGAEPVALAAEWLPPDTPAGDTWSLRPEPLAALAVGEADDGAALLALAGGVPRNPTGQPDFAAAGGERLARVLGHAVRAGRAQELLADPLFVAHADPVAVSAAWEAVGEATDGPSGLMAQAWDSVGRALLATDSAAERAAIVHAWVSGRGDAGLPERLAPVLDEAPWRALWARWDLGAGAALTLGRGPLAGLLLVADEKGAVRAFDPSDGALVQDLGSQAEFAPVALLCTAEGELIASERAVADGEDGTVRWAEHSASLHTGPVNCLAAALVETEPGAGVPLLLSGGADGATRLWSPGADPAPAGPGSIRPAPVTAVALSAHDEELVTAAAWADGLIRVGATELRLGAPGLALAVLSERGLAIGLPQGVLVLQAARSWF